MIMYIFTQKYSDHIVWLYMLVMIIDIQMHANTGFTKVGGVAGCGEGVTYLTSPVHSTDIGLHLGKACYPCNS